MRLMRKPLKGSSPNNLNVLARIKRSVPFCTRLAKCTLLAASFMLVTNNAFADAATATATAGDETPQIIVAVQQANQPLKHYSLAQGSRLSQLISQLSLSDNDYWYATAWLRHGQALKHQQKKLALLRLVDQQIAKQDKYSEQWQRVKQQISALIPSDRFTIAVHPDRVYADSKVNYRLKAQDKIIIPARPSTVSITGLTTTLSIAHKPSQDIKDYLDNASPFPMADNSIVWLIKPDTTTQQLPIAYWNKLDKHTLAPGSIVFVPAKTQLFSDQSQQINQLYLELLQNQIIGSPQGE